VPYFQHGGEEIYYRDSGRGHSALLFIHGWYQSGLQAWGALAQRFEKKYRVFIPDLPGHGLSPLKKTRDFSIAVNRELILEFIRHIRKTHKLQKLVLIGHSYGAFAVLDLAAKHSEAVDGVVGMAAIDDYRPYTRRLKQALAVPPFLVNLYYDLQAILGAFPYGDRLLLYGNSIPDLVPGRLAYAKIKNKTLSPQSSRAYMRAFTRGKVGWPDGKLRVPAFLFYGERDALTSSAWGPKIVPHFVKAETAVIPEAGHNVQISGSAAVAAELEPFFEKCFRHARKK